MWVSKTTVRPLRMEMITNMPAALQLHDVELRPRDTLIGLEELWGTSLHVSGLRLSNAEGWSKYADR
ncbi:MAG: hypothetical protein H7Y20_00435 [Bryobacteraceae bacterium]|nr:hypothetical protein [Bryobacteraceae bacterium]